MYVYALSLDATPDISRDIRLLAAASFVCDAFWIVGAPLNSRRRYQIAAAALRVHVKFVR